MSYILSAITYRIISAIIITALIVGRQGLFAYTHLYKSALRPMAAAVSKAEGPSIERPLFVSHEESGISLFLKLLAHTAPITLQLRRMYESGELDTVLPEFTALRGVKQHAFHRGITADEHTLHVMDHIDELIILHRISSDEARNLRLIGLFHDTGKAIEEDGRGHEDKSVVVFRRFLTRTGLPFSEFGRLGLIIQIHKYLGRIGTIERRKRSDEWKGIAPNPEIQQYNQVLIYELAELLTQAADTASALEMLNELYLLTIADNQAVPFGKGDTGNRYTSLLAESLRWARDSVEGAIKTKGETAVSAFVTQQTQLDGFIDDHIIVFRNNIAARQPGQVMLRVCEASQMSRDERRTVSEALRLWFKASVPVVHGEDIWDVAQELVESEAPFQLGSSEARYRYYFALSDLETNGEARVQVEGIIGVVERNNIIHIIPWEIHPDNRILQPQAPTARFIGVGRQLLWRVVEKELIYLKNGLVFNLSADPELEKEGLKADVVYKQAALAQYIRRSRAKTIIHLHIAARSGDLGARDILEELRSIKTTPNTSAVRQTTIITGIVAAIDTAA